MSDQAHPINLVFSIAPQSNMIEATGALLRERVEITAQSNERRTIFGKADPTRIEELRCLSEFSTVEQDAAMPTDPPCTAPIITLWGWSSSIRIASPRSSAHRKHGRMW